jgi:hydrogenase/urease accessory protein HupE
MSPEDLMAIAAVTLLAGLNGARHGRWLLATLPAAWMTGMTAGWALDMPFIPAWASPVVTALAGALVATDVRLSLAAVMGLGATLGMLHGLASGAELAASANGLMVSRQSDRRGNSAQCPNHGRLSAVSLG